MGEHISFELYQDKILTGKAIRKKKNHHRKSAECEGDVLQTHVRYTFPFNGVRARCAISRTANLHATVQERKRDDDHTGAYLARFSSRDDKNS